MTNSAPGVCKTHNKAVLLWADEMVRLCLPDKVFWCDGSEAENESLTAGAVRQLLKTPPRIFHVNWFRKDANGKFLWPGFGENMRVLKWIVDRCRGRADAEETPPGWVPGPQAFVLTGLEGFSLEALQKLQTINTEEWRKEVLLQDELFLKLYSHLPKELIFQREPLVSRL